MRGDGEKSQGPSRWRAALTIAVDEGGGGGGQARHSSGGRDYRRWNSGATGGGANLAAGPEICGRARYGRRGRSGERHSSVAGTRENFGGGRGCGGGSGAGEPSRWFEREAR